ncbi:DUF4352 domain-containing protein [Streptomyces sp. NP-1717]|uniref:DUF4352 domain-containing protein n=1 Tax=unclassified Streptomyces TaxID=2593676 RepID=UPI001F5D70C3|nr:DUF4352 domain-containing protein [Streptomyces sp. NP-1717]MCI3224770.1 DUF4352 domain-containing protein [Streptomyces sp. NP-1717]WTA71749.1 DUF4352 domain-containing protein [Streptomyces sp. NBC_00838]
MTAVVNEASRVPGDHAVDDPRAGASDGRKWVAVLAEVSNAGARPYGYGVSRSFTAVDTRGRRHTPLPVPADLTVGPVMTWPVPLGAGRSARGWLVFELPAEAALATLEFGRTRTSAAADWTL